MQNYRRQLRIIILAVSCLVAVFSGCTREGRVNVTPSVGLLQDNHFTVEDAVSKSFTRPGSEVLALGILAAPYWLKVRLSDVPGLTWGLTEQEWLIEVASPLFDYVELYVQNKGAFSVKRVNRTDSVDERAVQDAGYIFTIPEYVLNAEGALYLKVHAYEPINFSLYMVRADSLMKVKKDQAVIFGLFFGLIAAMFIYNLLLFFSIKDRAFIYYCLYIGSYGLFAAVITGYLTEFYTLTGNYSVQGAAGFFSLSTTLGAVLFSKHFLITRKYLPTVDRLLSVMAVAIFMLMFAVPILPYQLKIIVSNAVPFLAICIIYPSGIKISLMGFKPARYFILAWSFLVLSVSLFILANVKVIDSSVFVSNSQFFAVSAEAVLLSFALGYRINALKKETEQANIEKLKIQEQSLLKETALKESFYRFVPARFLKYLNKETVTDISRGDSVNKKLCVMFTDIRGFTGLSENKSSAEVFSIINAYLADMGPVIDRHSGTIDKFIGDAIMALFDHSSQAVLAAAEMYRLSQQKDYGFDMGIGIHYGELMLGTIGSHDRLDTTVIGDTVNLASRIEGSSKVYKAPILISEAVFLSINENDDGFFNRQGLAFREVDSVIVKGKKKPVVIYEVMMSDI